MKIGLLVFPAFTDTHLAKQSTHELGQRLEPSVLYLASEREGDTNVFIADNDAARAKECDVLLCSVYTRGWREFQEFSRKVGREKIIAGGYHPSADPERTLEYAHKVVTGVCGNIEDIIDLPTGGIIKGKFVARRMHRELVDMTKMRQVYPDVFPGMMTARSTASVGCVFDCDFCSTPQLSGRKMSAFGMNVVEEDVADMKARGVKALFVSDESFATHPKFKEVVALYGNNGQNFQTLYSFGTATALSEEKFKTLSQHGWHSLNLGLEEINTDYRKNRHLEEAAKLGAKYGVMINLSFIVNDFEKSLNESLRDYHLLFDAFLAYRPGMVAANFMMPFPGTGIWKKYKNRVTEDDFIKFDSKTPIFSQGDLAEWHKHMAVAVQLAYYYSDDYQKHRKFTNGDNLHLRFEELQKQFGMENEGWFKWFDPRDRSKTQIPHGLDPDMKEHLFARPQTASEGLAASAE